MRPHGFSIGQSVELRVDRHDGDAPPGLYTVVRLLPNDGADREYRVRHLRDGHERVVRESWMRPGPSFR